MLAFNLKITFKTLYVLLPWKQNSGVFLNILFLLFSFDPRVRGGGGDNGLCGEVPPKRGTVFRLHQKGIKRVGMLKYMKI